MQPSLASTPTPVETDLHGLPKTSWGGHVLFNRPLFPAGGGIIESTVLYPVHPDRPPEEAYIIAKDFGKRGLKGGGANHNGSFKSTLVIDAYSAARHIQQDEGSPEGKSIWRVTGPRADVSETFWVGEDALRTADALPINESVAARLRDPRVRNLLAVSLVLDLIALGVDPCVYEEGIEVVKKRNLIVPIGLPNKDIMERKDETDEALKSLKGTYTVEQYNTTTGRTTTWLLEIIGVLPIPQPRGTHYTATRNIDGRSAVSKKIVTVIDIGGGDIYAYEVDAQAGIVVQGKRLGDGTIAIARELLTLVEEKHGITLSEAQAQEALYQCTILKGGDLVDISPLLSHLKPRFANLLTTVTITQRMLTTFIIFTGGGTALLGEEIREKMQTVPGERVEGTDYLVLPMAIAPIANVIGLFAHGYYKVQQVIRERVADYLTLCERRNWLYQTIPTPTSNGAQEASAGALQAELTALQARLDTHVGQYYKWLAHQMQQAGRP